MGFKKTKIVVASLAIASLAACSTNKADVDNTGVNHRNVSTNDVNDRSALNKDLTRVNNPLNDNRTWNDRNDEMNHPGVLNPRNVSTGDLTNPNMSTRDYDWNDQNNGNGWDNRVTEFGKMMSTTEIHANKNGFITIDPNSFSTDTPSHKFPHSKRVQQGNFWYYSFDPNAVNPKTNLPSTGKNGVVTNPNTGNQGTVNKTTPKTTTPPAQQPITQAPAGISNMAQQVIDLTNAERKKNGLPALSADALLSKVAQTKSDDMEAKHYFSHTSPTYGSPFDMMRDFGVTYKSAGENIAMGQPTAKEVVTAWMNSEGHRKNILSPNYTNIGVGFNSKGNYWTQEFIGK
ncbi:CAP domain-containing protein [Bacillus sp. UNC438CL73TsuS30]|uniref:CAP domain-containing protein n=1 Tax=Bacillus sp. UNC438CL73TsuS30 TaxID=1340434 RepID=UPI000AA1DB7E|nr:CAP domain-containing protein [Bacillus sp. UNC438CL73TsuS30]